MNVGRSVHWGFKVLGPTKRESSIESTVTPSPSISITVPWRKDANNVDLPNLSARLMATDDSLTRLISLRQVKEQKEEKKSRRSSRLSVDYQPAEASSRGKRSSTTTTTTHTTPTGGGCPIPDVMTTTIIRSASSQHEYPSSRSDSGEYPSSTTLVASQTGGAAPGTGTGPVGNVITKLFMGLSTRIRNSYRFSLSVKDAPTSSNTSSANVGGGPQLDATSSSANPTHNLNGAVVQSQRASIGLATVHGGGQKRSSNLPASPPALEQTHNPQTPQQGATPKSMTGAAAATSNFFPERELSTNSTAASEQAACPQSYVLTTATTTKPAARRTHGGLPTNNAPPPPNLKHRKSVLLTRPTGYCAEDPLMKKPPGGFNRRMSRAKSTDFTSFDVNSPEKRKQSILLATPLPCPSRKSGNDLLDSQGRRLRTTKTMPFDLSALKSMEEEDEEDKKDISLGPTTTNAASSKQSILLSWKPTGEM